MLFHYYYQCIPSKVKQKEEIGLQIQGHTFKAQWSVDYFIELYGKTLCL